MPSRPTTSGGLKFEWLWEGSPPRQNAYDAAAEMNRKGVPEHMYDELAELEEHGSTWPERL